MGHVKRLFGSYSCGVRCDIAKANITVTYESEHYRCKSITVNFSVDETNSKKK